MLLPDYNNLAVNLKPKTLVTGLKDWDESLIQSGENCSIHRYANRLLYHKIIYINVIMVILFDCIEVLLREFCFISYSQLNGRHGKM